MRLFVSVLFVFFFILTTGDHLLQELSTTQENTILIEDANLGYVKGYDIYVTYCQNCHGKRGDGNGSFSGLSDAQTLPDFREASFNRSKSVLKRVIREGGTSTGLDPMMPGWKTVLTDEEMNQVVYFIHRLNQEGSLRTGLKTSLAEAKTLHD